MNAEDKKIIDTIDFDEVRENIAKEIGMTKEQLFPNIYGDEETKKQYDEYCERIIKMHGEDDEREKQLYMMIIKTLDKTNGVGYRKLFVKSRKKLRDMARKYGEEI